MDAYEAIKNRYINKDFKHFFIMKIEKVYEKTRPFIYITIRLKIFEEFTELIPFLENVYVIQIELETVQIEILKYFKQHTKIVFDEYSCGLINNFRKRVF
jgi:hypothetical protein